MTGNLFVIGASTRSTMVRRWRVSRSLGLVWLSTVSKTPTCNLYQWKWNRIIMDTSVKRRKQQKRKKRKVASPYTLGKRLDKQSSGILNKLWHFLKRKKTW